MPCSHCSFGFPYLCVLCRCSLFVFKVCMHTVSVVRTEIFFFLRSVDSGFAIRGKVNYDRIALLILITPWWWNDCSSSWLMIAYIALFSALLSRLTALACGSTWVISFLYRVFWISTEVVCLQRWHGWCHMKLQPSRRKFCVHDTTMHHVTSCKATYVRCMRV